MKNLRATITRVETLAAVRERWRTDTFRTAHDIDGSYIRRVAEAVADSPRLWCDLTDPSIERSHFTVWMNVIPDREEYSNPAISDLYYLHEFLHLVDMEHGPEPDHQKWAEKVWANEKWASLASEVYVYFQLPELREQTFGFEIWADRYLADRSLHELLRTDPDAFIEYFEAERGRAMSEPAPGDECERLIASYHRLNVEWAEVWRENYPRVEAALTEFRGTQENDPVGALKRLTEWLTEEQGDGICPFEQEARAFAAVVAAMRESS